jgi:cyclophilin family peptidyl-prolyl cis-trans isomerase
VKLRRFLAPLAAVAAAAVLAPAALAAVTPKPGADGCDHSKPPAFGAKKPTFSKPGNVLKRGEKASIVMVTSCGTVRIRLALDKKNPIPNSIAFLVTKHYYDGISVFRAVPDFVLQSGSPLNRPEGGPGYSVVGPVPFGYSYKVGDVAMAKTAAERGGTAGSQFFMITGRAGVQLNTEYGLLGHASDRASLVAIARMAKFASADQPPTKPLYIWTARLVRGA